MRFLLLPLCCLILAAATGCGEETKPTVKKTSGPDLKPSTSPPGKSGEGLKPRRGDR
jgi:hypothetical protein